MPDSSHAVIRSVPERARPLGSTGLLHALAMSAVFMVVAGLLFHRFSAGGLEMRDFREAIYYPVVSLLDGNNPYDTPSYLRSYPVEQEFPPYLPGILTLHLPFGVLPVEAAQVVYFVLTVGLTLAFAYLTLVMCGLSATVARTFGLATALLISRPGYFNLALGQCTVPVVIGTYLALGYCTSRPWLAGLGLAVAMLKPTYGMPASLLLLGCGQLRVVLGGIVVAGLLSAAPTVALIRVAGGVWNLAASLQESYVSFNANPTANPTSALYRLDTVATVTHLVGRSPATAEQIAIFVALLGTGGFAVWRLASARDQARRTLSNGVVCLTMLVCIYHQTYDGLLLALPLVALVADRWAPREVAHPGVHWLLLGLLAVPAANYVASRTAFSFLPVDGPWLTMTVSANGCALIVAWFIYVAVAFRAGVREASRG